MKIKLAVSDENYDEIKKFLTDKGIELDDDADFILTQKDKYVSHLTVRDPNTDEKLHIAVEDIIFIETFGHLVEINTEKQIFQTSDRLYQLVTMLDPEKFLRVSNSVIIAKRKVKQINPAFSMKFVLIMSNGARVDVTRSYYNIFKESFHI